MRILMIQPNYHSGGAEIAGNWPVGRVAYRGDALKHAGYTKVRFVDAMADGTDDRRLRAIIASNQPDVVMAAAMTPMIYQAQTTLPIAKEELGDKVEVRDYSEYNFVLEHLKYKGLSTGVDLGFGESKILSRAEIAKLKANRPDLSADIDFTGIKGRGRTMVSACAAPNDLRVEEQKAAVAETS